jgi:hypothetical protein
MKAGTKLQLRRPKFTYDVALNLGEEDIEVAFACVSQQFRGQARISSCRLI